MKKRISSKRYPHSQRQSTPRCQWLVIIASHRWRANTYRNHHYRNLQAAERSNVPPDYTLYAINCSQLSWQSSLKCKPQLTPICSCFCKEAHDPSSDAVMDGGAKPFHLDGAEVPDLTSETQDKV
ncbi:hypothetical protein PR048_023417 [Dryococelus australis]|uniref:Uncharacterized protein n=1 Tax=Dryococelus australis TaxID=614101 RepID=A0ABQ9GU10_9NEOP|nr:hypothetical protein PR048_023417 [Dryococelus australis]